MQRILFFILLFCPFSHMMAENWQLTLAEAETRLGQHCLEILAQRFCIDLAEAQIMQARLFENPTVSVEQNVYNSLNGRYFDAGHDGEFIVEVEQMIDIARLRNKRIKLETKNKQMAEQEYEEVVCALRADLRKKFISLYFARLSAGIYEQQIASLNTLAENVGQQTASGNIPLREKLRIETMLLSARKDAQEYMARAEELEADVRLLTGVPATDTIVPCLETAQLNAFLSSSVTFDVLSQLLDARPDMQRAALAVEAANINLKLQRAEALPDVSVKATYDKAGNFINNYWAIGASISIPIFNRNQGGIKAARTAVEQGRVQKELVQSKAESELHTAWMRLLRADDVFRKTDFSLEREYASMIDNVNSNYKQRNISLLEFVDYYEGYTEAIINLYEVRHELMAAIEAVNNIVNQRVFDIKY